MAERVVDGLEVVEVEAMTAKPRPGRMRPNSVSNCSRNSTRFGRLVSMSWRARCAILASARRRSVMSSCTATQPPSCIGLCDTATMRPSINSWVKAEASRVAIAASRPPPARD